MISSSIGLADPGYDNIFCLFMDDLPEYIAIIIDRRNLIYLFLNFSFGECITIIRENKMQS